MKKSYILDKVLASEEFANSERCQEILKYLVEASLSNHSLDEFTIAKDIFGKEEFNPTEDASVRVYISQIRKKLKYYYKTEGKDDKIKLTTPKGNYNVKFIKKSHFIKDYIKHHFLNLIFPILTLLLSIALIYFLSRANNKKSINISENDPVWFEILQSNKPTTLVLGDYFFLTYQDGEEHSDRNIRDPLINSKKDFEDYIKNNPSNKDFLTPQTYTYMRPNSIWAVEELLPILKAAESSFHIKLASELEKEEINTNNLIFVGDFKAMYNLKPLLKKINVGFSLHPFYLDIYNKNDDIVRRFKNTMGVDVRKYTEYSLISKFSGENNNTIMLIIGFDQASITQAVNEVTDPNFSKILLNDRAKSIKRPFLFKSVLEVKGYEWADLSSNIKYFDVID